MSKCSKAPPPNMQQVPKRLHRRNTQAFPDVSTVWTSISIEESSWQALTSNPADAELGVHTLWDQKIRHTRARLSNAANAAILPTNKNPDYSMNQDEPMNLSTDKQNRADRVAKGFVHPSQHSLRTWARPSTLPVIEMPLQGVAWHSPKTQEPGGSHSTPGLTLRSTRVRDDLFFAIGDGADSPVALQFRIPMAALVTMLARYQSLGDKPGGYMMYLTEDGELRFPTSDDETLAGGPAPSDSDKD